MMKSVLNKRKSSKDGEQVMNVEQLEQEQQPSLLDLAGLGMRMITLYGDLDEKKASDIVADLFAYNEMKDSFEAQLKTMDPKLKKQIAGNLSHKDPVKFLISTFGGNAVDMFGIYDAVNMLQQNDVEVHTVGSGKVMSAGVLLLACGTKGKRTIGKNCRVMVHPVVGGAHGPSHDIQNEVEEILQTQKQYVQCLAQSTKLSVSRLNKLISEKRNIYLSAEEAVKFGIADKII